MAAMANCLKFPPVEHGMENDRYDWHATNSRLLVYREQLIQAYQ